MKRMVLCVMALLWLPVLGWGATRYASPAGSGSTCSQAVPCSLTTGIGQLVAGDTLFLRGGTYPTSTTIGLSASGSSGNLIKLWNYPGETPVIDGATTTTSFWELFGLTGSWWHFKGLEITNAAFIGLYIKGASSNNIVEMCNIHHNVRLAGSGSGVAIEAGSNNLVLNNDLHHNATFQSSGTGGDGLGLGGATGGSGNVVRGNRAWRNHDDGFDFSGARGVIIEQNWSWENGKNDSLVDGSGNGAGFKLGLNNAADGGHTVRQNLAWNNAEDGFTDNGAGTVTTLYNNTAMGNNTPGFANYAFFSPVANILRNNIAENGDTVSFNAAVVHDHNSWNGCCAVTAGDFVSVDFTANLGARQADGSLPVSTFLTLTSGSDLIDKGVNVGLPFTGTAPDLGAYEFTTIITCSPTTLNTAVMGSDGGFAWVTPDQASFGTTADTGSASAVSTLRLFESATELGPAHAAHADVRALGLGRFSHWSGDNNVSQYIVLSATDNSNVTTNGRTYTYTTGCTPVVPLTAPHNFRVQPPTP